VKATAIDVLRENWRRSDAFSLWRGFFSCKPLIASHVGTVVLLSYTYLSFNILKWINPERRATPVVVGNWM
jgi:hypothetical protein